MDQNTRDLVIETHTMMKAANKRLAAFEKKFEKIDETFDKHAKRIGGHDTFRAWILGLFSIGGLGTGVVTGFKHFFDGGAGG